MNERIQTLIDKLHLQTHPEGGYYREVFRSPAEVAPADGRPKRSALTAIYFLLTAGQYSRWHRVLSDEIWSHLEGGPLELLIFDEQAGSSPRRLLLGPYGPQTEPIRVVPAGIWQAARPLGEYALVGCYVGPGFDFADFSLASDRPAIMQAIGAGSTEFAALL